MKYPYRTAEEYKQWWTENTKELYGKCWCGCGADTALSAQCDFSRGRIRNAPMKYITGHWARTKIRASESDRLDYRKKFEEHGVDLGYCCCGCGERTETAPESDKRAGWICGEPRLYVHNHHLRGTRSGSNNPAWKGGRFKDVGGYWKINCREHPFVNSNGNVLEHRFIMEDHLGRFLWPWEVVHHVNEDRSDNRIENLQLIASNGEHTRLHARMRRAELAKLRPRLLINLIQPAS